jgi:hypothetical protein
VDIITAIDAATGCQQCGGPLGASPSDLFCDQDCQAAWSAEQVGAPTTADVALPPRTGNLRADYMIALLVRLTARSPEAEAAADARLSEVRADLEAAFTAIAEALRPAVEAVGEAFRAIGGALVPLAEQIEQQAPTDPHGRALWLRQHRNTGPARRQRPPRAITPRRSR